MNFAEPKYLYLLLPVLLLFGLLRFFSSRSYRARLKLLSRDFEAKDLRELWEWPRRILLLLALLFLLLALARPRWDYQWADVKHKGSDIIVVLDLSRSMLATDVKPNRLELAKRSVRDLMGAIKGDRIGLILFSGSAFIQCPLTYDLASFGLFLDQSDTELLPEQGTEIGAALELADRAFAEGSESGSRGKTVLLISDGEDHGESAFESAARLKEKGVRIFTLGMGGEGSPIPGPDGSFIRNQSGELVVSRPDLKGLAKIAEEGGGRLLSGREGLDRFYEAALGKGDEERSTREKIWAERHMILSFLAFLLLTIESVLPRPRLIPKRGLS